MSSVQLSTVQVGAMAGVSAYVVIGAIKRKELAATTKLAEGGKRSQYKINMADAKEWVKSRKSPRQRTNGHAEPPKNAWLEAALPTPDPVIVKNPGLSGSILTFKALREQTDLLKEIRDLLRQVLS